MLSIHSNALGWQNDQPMVTIDTGEYHHTVSYPKGLFNKKSSLDSLNAPSDKGIEGNVGVVYGQGKGLPTYQAGFELGLFAFRPKVVNHGVVLTCTFSDSHSNSLTMVSIDYCPRFFFGKKHKAFIDLQLGLLLVKARAQDQYILIVLRDVQYDRNSAAFDFSIGLGTRIGSTHKYFIKADYRAFTEITVVDPKSGEEINSVGSFYNLAIGLNFPSSAEKSSKRIQSSQDSRR